MDEAGTILKFTPEGDSLWQLGGVHDLRARDVVHIGARVRISLSDEILPSVIEKGQLLSRVLNLRWDKDAQNASGHSKTSILTFRDATLGQHVCGSKPMGSHFGVGEFTTHCRTYFSGWIGMLNEGTIWV